MAKDDYHVIVCKILKYLYQCLKSGVDVDQFQILGIIGKLPETYAEYIIEALHIEGYVDGIYPTTAGGEEVYKLTPETRITPKGIEYLNNDQYMRKVKTYLDRH